MRLFPRLGKWTGAFIFTVCTASFLALTPATAHAQNKPGTFDVTPFLGIGFGSDLDGASVLLGAAGAYNYTENLSFEAEMAWIPDIAGGNANIDTPVFTLSGNGVYHFNTGTKINPYATLGIGLGHTSVTVHDTPSLNTSETGFQVNLGGGAKADLTDKLAVRGDLRYFHTNDQPAYWRLYGGVVFKFPR